MEKENQQPAEGKHEEDEQLKTELQEKEQKEARGAEPHEEFREVEVLPKLDVTKPLTDEQVRDLGKRELLEFGIAVGTESKIRARAALKFVWEHGAMYRRIKKLLRRPGRRTDLKTMPAGCGSWKAFAETHTVFTVRYMDMLLRKDSDTRVLDAKITLALPPEPDAEGKEASRDTTVGATSDASGAEKPAATDETDAELDPQEPEEEEEQPPPDEKVRQLTYAFGELFGGFDSDPLPKIKSFILALSERVRQSLLRAALEVAKGGCPLDSAVSVKEYTLSCRPEVRARIAAGSAMAIKELQPGLAVAPAGPNRAKLSKQKEKELRREQARSIIVDELRQRHSSPSGRAWQTDAIGGEGRIKTLGLTRAELDYVLAIGDSRYV